AFHDRVRGWVNNTIIFFVITYVITTMATLLYLPHMAAPFKQYPALGLIALANMLAIANIPREIYHGRDFNAFVSSCCAIAALLTLLAIGLFPNMIRTTIEGSTHLGIMNAASSEKTLWIMLIIAMCGMPMVIAYTGSIYWVFRGKVKLDKMSY
ncbi:MAG: cytochrome d ubiquinol oxidase subunit II, partial [Phycisphaerae bacterium]